VDQNQVKERRPVQRDTEQKVRARWLARTKRGGEAKKQSVTSRNKNPDVNAK
jgi:hypothetical protein